MMLSFELSFAFGEFLFPCRKRNQSHRSDETSPPHPPRFAWSPFTETGKVKRAFPTSGRGGDEKSTVAALSIYELSDSHTLTNSEKYDRITIIM